MLQVPLEVIPQVVTHSLESLWAQSEEVLPVRISAEFTGELLIPTRALDARKEMARNYREQLKNMKRVEKILEVLRNSVAQFQDNDSKKGVMLNFLFQDVLLLQIF